MRWPGKGPEFLSGTLRDIKLDIPFFKIPFGWEKPEKFFVSDFVKRKMGPNLVARLTFFNKYHFVPAYTSVLKFGMLTLIVLVNIKMLPPVHNYRLKKAYENRYKRHLEYLSENKNYEKALLQAYKKLGPQV